MRSIIFAFLCLYKLAEYSSIPFQTAVRVLDMAKVSNKDTVYDLGSGDGRILAIAVQRYGARAVGIELNKRLCAESKLKMKDLGVSNKVKIICGNVFDFDFSSATVVVLNLETDALMRLEPKLKSLKPGTRIVSNSANPAWNSERQVSGFYLYVKR